MQRAVKMSSLRCTLSEKKYSERKKKVINKDVVKLALDARQLAVEQKNTLMGKGFLDLEAPVYSGKY